MTSEPRSHHRLSRRVLLGAGAFAGCLVIGLLLGRTQHDTEGATRAPAEALPVLQPSGYGPEDLPFAPGAMAAMPIGDTEGPAPSATPLSASGDGGVGASGAASDAFTGTPDPTGPSGEDPSSTTTGESTEPTGSPEATADSTAPVATEPTLGDPPALADLPELATDLDLYPIGEAPAVLRLLDPCIDGGDGCPDGVSGTILAGEREQLDILGATGAVSPAQFALYDECVRDLRHPDARAAILAITSNHPGTFTMTGAWSGTATTSTRQRDRWQADRDRGDVHRVVTCAVLNPAGRRGEIRIDGVDDLGSTDRLVTVVDAVALDHKRPPISVTPTGDMALRVMVPLRANEVAEVVAHTRTDDTPGGPTDCGGNVLRRVDSTATQSVVALPAFLLDLPAYPYDRAWDRVALVDVRLMAGSVPYDLCVRWLSRGRSFETPQLVDAEARLVLPPTRNDLQVSVAGVIPGREPIDANELIIDLKTAEGLPGCTLAAGSPGFPLAVGPEKYATPVPMCLMHTGAVGEWTTATVTLHGAELRTSIRLSTRICHTGSTRIVPCVGGFTEWYEVTVPKPTGGTSLGRVILRFDYDAPHAVGDARGEFTFYTVRDTWGVFPGGDVTLPTDNVAEVVSPQPQLDTFATTVRPEGEARGQSTLVVQWVADRPVTVTAAVEGNDPETCSRDPRPSAASTEPATSGTLLLEGLCAGTRSSVGFTLRTPTGETASYSDVDGVHADRIGPGVAGTTRGIPVTISPALLFGDLNGLPAGTVARTLMTYLEVNGRPAIAAHVFHDLPSLNTRLDWFPCSSLAAFRFTPATYVSPGVRPPIPSSPQPMVLPEDVQIRAYGMMDLSTEPCAEPNGRLAQFREIAYYNFAATATLAGPASALATPNVTFGGVTATPAVVTQPELLVQLNARPG